MTQPTAANAKMVDKGNLPQMGDQLAAINRLDYSTNGGTPTTLIDTGGSGSRDDMASINAKLIEVLDVIRYHGLIAGGTQVTAAESKIVDLGNIPMLGNRQAAITDLTNSTGSTVEDTIDYTPSSSFSDDTATLGRDINLVLDVLEYHLLITGSGTQVTAAASKMTDKNNNPQIGEQQPAIVDLTDSTGGVISDIVDYNLSGYRDDVSALALKINEILALLRLHGLIAD